MGKFSLDFSKASITETGNKFNEGQYVGRIIKCLFLKTRKAGNAFICEFEIVKSVGENANPVGSNATFFCSMQDEDIAAPNLLGFGAAVSDIEASEKDLVEGLKEEMNDLLSDAIEGKYNDKLIQINASNRTSKENRAYVRLNFAPYKEEKAKGKKAA